MPSPRYLGIGFHQRLAADLKNVMRKELSVTLKMADAMLRPAMFTKAGGYVAPVAEPPAPEVTKRRAAKKKAVKKD